MAAMTGRGKNSTDEWSEWLLHVRHADDPGYERIVRSVVERYADRVLDFCCLSSGMTLVDIGTGDGLLAFRAIERIGGTLRVVLTDVSAPMLRHTEESAARLGVSAQCRFVHCSAESLLDVDDASADVVAARAAIAYVPDKAAAFREFFRVLKPGGRVAMAEPILQDEAFFVRALKRRIDDPSQPKDPFLTLLHRWKSAQFPDTEEACAASPITNFSERDLVNFARNGGLVDIHLELHIDVFPSLIKSWKLFLDNSPHPWAPPLRRILEERCNEEERAFFERMVRPTVESGKNVATDRIAYLSARKPQV